MEIFSNTTPISLKQFKLYRVIFGCYLLIHFLQLLPDAVEVFSREGVIKNVENLPAYGKLPIFLFNHDVPIIVVSFVISLCVASLGILFNIQRKLASAWIFYGWVSLFNRNPFISNPSLAYIGWILLSFLLIPNEPKKGDEHKWRFPDMIYYGMWAIVPLSYTVSGLHKLQCPSWIDGTALHHVLTSLLTRDNLLVKAILASPDIVLKISTWVSLFAEISFLFLGAFKRLRKIYWYFFLVFHFGILCTVNFTNLTLGMLVAHLYMFDGRWLAGYKFVNMNLKKYKMSDLKSDIATYVANSTSENHNLRTWVCHASIAGGLVGCVAIYMSNHTDIVTRLCTLTVDSLWGFGYIIVGLGCLMILERIYPAVKLEQSLGWWKWVVGINAFQLFAVLLASYTWEPWLHRSSYLTSATGFYLRDYVSPFVGGLIAYAVNQWIFYWWHYLRHHVYALWIICHQFHHSPKRIETITSFYKHPIEIIIDSQIMAVLLYSVLGLTQESSIWLSIFSAFGEYFYHMNISTPKFIGYLFQRPESHRVHHARNKRINCPNYSDFPLWDILNDTFDNPDVMNEPTGFSNETMRYEMLAFKDVLHATNYKHTIRSTLCVLLVLWGLVSSVAFLTHMSTAQTSVLVSSPLPLVFSSYKGVETFSTTFWIDAQLEASAINKYLDVGMYLNLGGSYNRRNVYGAIFAFGPLFDDDKLMALRREILHYAICEPGIVREEFGISERILKLAVTVRSKTKGEDRVWVMDVKCQ